MISVRMGGLSRGTRIERPDDLAAAVIANTGAAALRRRWRGQAIDGKASSGTIRVHPRDTHPYERRSTLGQERAHMNARLDDGAAAHGMAGNGWQEKAMRGSE